MFPNVVSPFIWTVAQRDSGSEQKRRSKRRTEVERERLSDTEKWKEKEHHPAGLFPFLSLRGTLCFFLNKASGKKKQSGHAHPDLVTCVCSPWISIFDWRVEKWEVRVLSADWFLSCKCVCVCLAVGAPVWWGGSRCRAVWRAGALHSATVATRETQRLLLLLQ